MSRLGFFCFSGTGHLNPTVALARSLKVNGHEIIFFNLPITRAVISRAELTFVPLKRAKEPDNASGCNRESENLSWRTTVQAIVEHTSLMLQTARELVQAQKIEALVADQCCFATGSIAESLGLPYVSLSLHPPLHLDITVPLTYFNWTYRRDILSYMRNHIGSILVNRAARPILTLVNKYRDSWGLERFSNIFEIFSRHPTISQLPQAFDFPYRHSPKKLFYTGPFLDREARRNTEFPFEKLNGRPLIYASLGTIQTNRPQIFQIISRACEGLGVQLVISLGGGSLMPQNLPRLAGDPLVVHYAPQLEILQKARITITHAGINTTLESLAAGVPLVAIPISDDQPGVGARIRWTGTGLVVEAGRLSVSALRYAIVEILQKPQYRKAALQMQEQIRNCGGLRLAAALVEEQLGRPDPWCQS